jgi:predicted short-subunit dehydrogenase-like oxidoreductase (DUF2520 family)
VSRKSSSDRHLTISIAGAGNLGSALALTLSSAQYPVKYIAVRASSTGRREAKTLANRIDARMVTLGREPLDSNIVWLTVPDDAIAAVALRLSKTQDWKDRFVFHSSGALTSDALAPLHKRGARVASVHPMMTFVRGETPEMAGVSFAVEGDAAAVRVARSIIEDLDASAFVIQKQKKVLYHAFGSFASPLVIALLATLEHVAEAAGVRRQDIKAIMTPLLWQTLRNYLKKDAASAFSGPLVRGDLATIEKHLAELKKLPQARAVYVALARASLKNLPVRNRKAIAKILE